MTPELQIARAVAEHARARAFDTMESAEQERLIVEARVSFCEAEKIITRRFIGNGAAERAAVVAVLKRLFKFPIEGFFSDLGSFQNRPADEAWVSGIAMLTYEKCAPAIIDALDKVRLAQGIEARRAETHSGSVADESPVAEGDAHKGA